MVVKSWFSRIFRETVPDLGVVFLEAEWTLVRGYYYFQRAELVDDSADTEVDADDWQADKRRSTLQIKLNVIRFIIKDLLAISQCVALLPSSVTCKACATRMTISSENG